jgi:hypothetical protein
MEDTNNNPNRDNNMTREITQEDTHGTFIFTVKIDCAAHDVFCAGAAYRDNAGFLCTLNFEAAERMFSRYKATIHGIAFPR